MLALRQSVSTGTLRSAEAFNAPARHFQDRFHCIVPDVRGHGESAWSPTGAYQYSDQVSDLEGMVTQLGWSGSP